MASSLPSEQLSQRSSPAIEPVEAIPAIITPSTSANTLLFAENHNTTPHRPRPQSLQSTPKSAPASQYRTQLQLTSPEAARRSKRSLEAIHVARALKDGFLRLKARADPQHLLSPTRSASRPLRTYSATMAPSRASHLLVRHHSSVSPRTLQAASCPQPPRRMAAPSMPSAPGFALSASAREDHAWRPRPCLPAAASVRSGAVEQAAEAMLFMRSQSSSSLNNDHLDSVSPPPSSSSVSQGLVDSGMALSQTNGNSIDAAPHSEFDAYETEDEIILPPIKRQRANLSLHNTSSPSAATSTAHHLVPSPQKHTAAAFEQRRD